MKKMISDFTDFKFLTESTGGRIKENRYTLGQMLKSAIPNSEILIWLLDQDESVNYLALSFASHATNTNQTKNFVEVKSSENDADFLTLNESVVQAHTQRLLAQSSISNFQQYHCVIHDALTNNKARSLTHTGEVLGWMTVNFDESDKLNSEQESVILLCSRVLSMLVRQGRDARVLTSIEQVHKRISHTRNLQSIIEDIASDLRRMCNMNEFFMRSSNCNKNIIGGPANENKIMRKLLNLNFSSLLGRPTDEGGIPRKVNKFEAGDGHLKLNPSPNYVYMPLVEKGIQFENISLAGRDDFLDVTESKQIVSHEMFLLDKSNEFLSNAISTTDLKVCKSVTRALQGHLSSTIYEKKFLKVSRYFQKLDISTDLDVSKFKNFIVNNIIDCDSLCIYSAEINGENIIVRNSRCFDGEELGQDYNIRIRKYLEKFYSIENQAEDRIRVGSDVRSGNFLLEFHLSNSFNKSRLLTFEFPSRLLSLNDFHILHHLMSELQLYFKSADSLQQRLSDLAQVRHAIKAPLAAANASIEEFHDTMITKSRTESMWKRFRTEDRDWEMLFKARDLGETAMLLAESGRYLFSEVDHNSLNIKDFSLRALIDLVLNTFSARQKTDGIVIVTKIDPPQGSQNGDKELLYVAFANLLDNAIKYTVKSASNSFYKNIYDEEYIKDSAVVEVSLKIHERSYTFSVSNVGAHIPEADLETIFKPFGRNKQYHNLHLRHGTGIGLPASLKILNAHVSGTKIKVYSKKLNPNSKLAKNEFSFELPFRVGEKVD